MKRLARKLALVRMDGVEIRGKNGLLLFYRPRLVKLWPARCYAANVERSACCAPTIVANLPKIRRNNLTR